MKDEKIMVRIPRNGNEELTVRTGNYWNVDIVDIRWYANGTPTKKGVRMNIEEMKDVAKTYHEANKDGKITKEEQQAIAKECMDVMMAAVKLVWKF